MLWGTDWPHPNVPYMPNDGDLVDLVPLFAPTADSAATPARRRSRHTVPIQPLRRRWYATLWIQVVVAMSAGVLVGHFAPAAGERMQPFGDAFIKAIRMLIAPIVFSTVVLGIANMNDMTRVGRVAIKALIYFEVMTTVALVLGLLAVNLWKPGAGMNVNPGRSRYDGGRLLRRPPLRIRVSSRFC